MTCPTLSHPLLEVSKCVSRTARPRDELAMRFAERRSMIQICQTSGPAHTGGACAAVSRPNVEVTRSK